LQSTKTLVLSAPKLNKKTNQETAIRAKVHSLLLAVTVFRSNENVTKKLASGVPNQAAQADGNSRWRMSRAKQTVIGWTWPASRGRATAATLHVAAA